ncbi:MAG: DNA sulfur modification protein DndD [Cyanobacteria bacterium SID2]|nr:DNA sulfur modification protein DndD [Cyanobacteria bacterium SID2]MBP0002425.1 DNA sulfur modification protein DndD [Cyanobacteria bacterium SBC]
MKFLELVLQNFGPYSGRQVVNLSPTDDGELAPIVLFGGMNGGGKTTLMDAIRLALYGHRAQCSTRGTLNYGDFLTQCVNRHAPPEETTSLELLFEHVVDDRLVKYRIVRSWTRDPKDGKDKLGILDREWPDLALAETWDEYIESLLPLGISNLFLFDGEQVKELAELDEPPPLVVSAIKSLLGLELAEQLAVDLEILVNRKRKDLANAEQRAALEEIEQRLEQCLIEFNELDRSLKQLTEQLDRAIVLEEKAIEIFRAEGGKIAGEKNRLEAQLKAENDKVDQQRDRVRELMAGSLPLMMVRSLLEKARRQGNEERRIKTAQLLRESIEQRDTRLLEQLELLEIPPMKVEKIRQFLAEETPDLDGHLERWLDLDDRQLDRLSAILDGLDAQVSQSREVRETLRKLKGKAERTERQIAIAAPPEDYNRLSDKMNRSKEERQRLENLVAVEKHKRYEAEEKLLKTRKELATYGEEHIDRGNADRIIQMSKQVQETLALFRERLTLRKLNKLEIEVTECFRYLLHKSNLVHRVTIEATDFSLSLFDRSGQFVPKHRLSAGEKQLLAISFLWGLARVSERLLPVAIDTPLGRLDSSHRQNLIERYFPAASEQVILLSTDTEIQEEEVKQLRDCGAIAREYLLDYDPKTQKTTVRLGYFWPDEA